MINKSFSLEKIKNLILNLRKLTKYIEIQNLKKFLK